MTEPAFQSALQLAESIRNRRVGSLELLEYFLARVERLNPAINAVVVLDAERARAAARDADAALIRGEIAGPLHGVPMTVKESYDMAGLITTRGNTVWRDNRAHTDALAISRLKAAGAVIFGKTNVPLNLADFQSYNDIYGTTSNPWDVTRGSGGSSGGSAAALAAGLTGLEAGSDIGGSIRNPAHFCGVFGHKPTFGLIPPRGHAAPGVLAQSDLTVVGPMARSAADLEAALGVMAGPDEIMSAGYRLSLQPCPHASLKNFRVALWPNDARAPVTAETERRVRAVADLVRNAGGEVHEDARPEIDFDESMSTFQSLLQVVMASRNPEETWRRMQQDAAALAADDQSERAQTLRRQVATYREYVRANEVRTKARWAWHRFFQKYDVVISPIMATPAFPHDHRPFHERTITVDNQVRPYFEQLYWAGHAIYAYLPATVIPSGAMGSGLPIGVQIIGPEYGDLKTIGFAKLLEAAGLHFVAPPGFA